jgi:hypothetical protein
MEWSGALGKGNCHGSSGTQGGEHGEGVDAGHACGLEMQPHDSGETLQCLEWNRDAWEAGTIHVVKDPRGSDSAGIRIEFLKYDGSRESDSA